MPLFLIEKRTHIYADTAQDALRSVVYGQDKVFPCEIRVTDAVEGDVLEAMVTPSESEPKVQNSKLELARRGEEK